MSEKKNMTGKENSFHMENFRRRSRYAAVFLVLILAFAAITVLNINSGDFPHSAAPDRRGERI